MKAIQRAYLFERFCQTAEYMPQLEKYVVKVNGKRLSSDDTEDLFKQYLKAIK